MMYTEITVSTAVERELKDVAAQMGSATLTDVIGRLLDIRRGAVEFAGVRDAHGRDRASAGYPAGRGRIREGSASGGRR